MELPPIQFRLVRPPLQASQCPFSELNYCISRHFMTIQSKDNRFTALSTRALTSTPGDTASIPLICTVAAAKKTAALLVRDKI
jgi:hypothetical protein